MSVSRVRDTIALPTIVTEMVLRRLALAAWSGLACAVARANGCNYASRSSSVARTNGCNGNAASLYWLVLTNPTGSAPHAARTNYSACGVDTDSAPLTLPSAGEASGEARVLLTLQSAREQNWDFHEAAELAGSRIPPAPLPSENGKDMG